MEMAAGGWNGPPRESKQDRAGGDGIEIRLAAGTRASIRSGQRQIKIGRRCAPLLHHYHGTQFGANAGNPLIAGANADPEGDGIANWLEYAFGLHPLQANVSKLPTATLQTTGGGTYLTMKYRQLIGQTTLDYNVGVSGDLQTWDWTESQIEQLGPPVATGDGLTEEVTVRVATAINGMAQKFLKLRVEQLP